MRVVVVNHSSAIDHLGGAERSLLALMDDWAARRPDLEPIAVTKKPEGLFVDEWSRRGWRHESFAYQGWLTPAPFAHPVERAVYDRAESRAAGEVVAAIARLEPDLVLTNTMVVPWGAVGAAIHGVPHAWFVREFGAADHGMHFVGGEAATLTDIGRLSLAVFANSRAVADYLQPAMPEHEISVTYPTVDSAWLLEAVTRPVPLEPFPGEADLRVAVVGRLTPTKGQWRVVEAVGRLREQGVSIRVCFVGAVVDAEHDRVLATRARELGIAEQIVFAGEQPDPAAIVARADVCVTPSGMEAFGRTTLEYLWCGKPVIASSTGGGAEIVSDEENGFLVAPDDIDALTERLARYARDPELLARHARTAVARARQLADDEWGNPAAIARLESLVGATRPRLPLSTVDWLAAPERIVRAHPRGLLTVRYGLHLARQRGARLLRDPLGVLRRRWARRRG